MNISKFDNLILLLLHSFFFVLSDGKLKESGQFVAVGKSLQLKPPLLHFLKVLLLVADDYTDLRFLFLFSII